MSLRFAVFLLLSSCAPAAPAPSSHHAESAHHRFDDASRWAKVFDDPSRDRWQRPDDVVRWLRLAPDARVADLGAGTGYFTMRLARAVPKGRVLAVDVEPQMVEYTEKRAAREGLDNVTGVVAGSDDPKLPDGVSLVLVVDTYHHLKERTAYFRRVGERLTPDGRVVIVDFRQGKLPVGPPDEHKIPPERVTTELEAAGFARCASFDELPYQYVLSFAKRCP